MHDSAANPLAICSLPPAPLHSEEMTIDEKLICDGCGQAASAEHLAARFRRLEWATRWRPLHIQTLLLGAVAPTEDAEFIYSDAGEFSGEAAWVLGVAGVSGAGKPADAVHHELQRAGVFVAHVLDCPFDGNADRPELAALLAKRVPTTLTRIRRSIKPKQAVLIGEGFDSLLGAFTTEALGCEVIFDRGAAFKLDGTGESVARTRAALGLAAAANS